MAKGHTKLSIPKAARASWRGSITRHQPHGRVIKTYILGGREYYLHATKGWRSRRV